MTARRWIWLLWAVYLLPFGLLALWSIADQWRFPEVWPALTGRHWQTLLLSGQPLTVSLLRSLTIAVPVAILSTATGFLLSHVIAHHKQRHTLLFITYLPYVVAPVILAGLIYLHYLTFGLAGTAAGVVLGHLLLTIPYATLLFTAFWTPRIASFEGMAQTMGANRWHLIRHVWWPLGKRLIFTGLFQTFLISWFEFGLTRLLGTGKVATLPVLVYQFTQEANPYLAAVACLLLMVPPAVLLGFNKLFLFTKLP